MARLYNARMIIDQAQKEIGITQKSITTVTNTLDQDISQMLALLIAVADEVLLEEPYRTTLGDEAWVTDKDGTPKLIPTTDSDLVLIDGRLMIAGLKYRFMKAKGLEYGEEMRDFAVRMNKLAVRVNARVLDLDYEESRTV
jgi:hypothetical protein